MDTLSRPPLIYLKNEFDRFKDKIKISSSSSSHPETLVMMSRWCETGDGWRVGKIIRDLLTHRHHSLGSPAHHRPHLQSVVTCHLSLVTFSC